MNVMQKPLAWVDTSQGGATAQCHFGKYIIGELLVNGGVPWRQVYLHHFLDGCPQSTRIGNCNEGDLVQCKILCETHRKKLLLDELGVKTADQLFEEIAAARFRIDTLEIRNSDSLDFHEVAVWEIKKALSDAFIAGKTAIEVHHA